VTPLWKDECNIPILKQAKPDISGSFENRYYLGAGVVPSLDKRTNPVTLRFSAVRATRTCTTLVANVMERTKPSAVQIVDVFMFTENRLAHWLA
jgi:hypothetical protein